jgi:hypothetical protein
MLPKISGTVVIVGLPFKKIKRDAGVIRGTASETPMSLNTANIHPAAGKVNCQFVESGFSWVMIFWQIAGL